MRKRAAVTLLCLATLTRFSKGDDQSVQQTQDEARMQLREDAARDAEATMTKNLLTQFIARVKDTSDLLGQFQDKANTFFPRLQKLLTDDDGKRLALDDAAFLEYLDIHDHPPATLEEIKAKKVAIDSILAKLKEQLAAPTAGYTPPVTMKDEVEDARQWSVSNLAKTNELSGWLDSVIAKNADKDISKAPTLGKRIDAFNAAKIDALAKSKLQVQPEVQQTVQDAAIAAIRLQAEQDAQSIIREKNAELERLRIQQDMQIKQMLEDQKEKEDALNKQLAEAKAARLKSNAQNEATVKQAEEDAEFIKKRQECHNGDVQAVLAPFISKGRFQPKTGKGADSNGTSITRK